MELEYEVTLEDVTAFALFHHAHSPHLRRRRRLLRVGLAGTLVLVAAVVATLARSPLLATVGLAFALAFYWMFPRRYERGLRESVAKMYAEGKNLDVLGKTKLSLDDAFIVESTATRDVRTRWSAVEALVDTDLHLFIYVTGSTALVVPKRDLPAQTLNRFVETVRAHLPA
jgi:hypothetical protein